ncbi:MAG: hypothetical protein B1H07_03960 [Campylobacteraceae bacterium 4484_166]|nr:MAG: hypothetical protein B1H07_03960 [Campylobacteraceae bacterium 4484_166]
MLNAGLINGIAIKINGTHIITLYDIDKRVQESKLTRQQAIDLLINEKLMFIEIEKNEITVLDEEVEDYIDNLSAKNNISKEQFIIEVKKQKDIEKFKDDIKTEIKKYKLIGVLSQKEISKPSEEELKIYYNNNIKRYAIGNSMRVYPFEKVKQSIYATILKEKESKFLKNYFYKLRITTDIQMIR